LEVVTTSGFSNLLEAMAANHGDLLTRRRVLTKNGFLERPARISVSGWLSELELLVSHVPHKSKRAGDLLLIAIAVNYWRGHTRSELGSGFGTQVCLNIGYTEIVAIVAFDIFGKIGLGNGRRCSVAKEARLG